MLVKVLPSEIKGKISPLSSKSVAHRSLICAFLSGKEVQLVGNFDLVDIDATVGCLNSLGGRIEKNGLGYLVKPGSLKTECKLNAIESGSTLRFMLPLACALGVNGEIAGSERLFNRPMSPLLSVLEQNGITFSSKTMPIKFNGKLKAGVYKIDGSISSQFITGLILALCVVEGESVIEIENNFVSKDYVEITLNVLKDFGIEIERLEKGYKIIPQKFNPPKEYLVEGDWSSACFMGALGLTRGEVSLTNLNVNSFQGDKICLEVFKEIGGEVRITKDEIIVKKNQLKAITFDAENYPDFVPVLSCILALSKGVSVIKNVARLKDKESDRLAETIKMLTTFGIKAYYENNSIVIEGGQPKGAVYHSPNDHRMAMSATVLALNAQGESQIENAQCISKSYPCFYEHVKVLGGKVSV